jgi:hypothetical protein
VSITVQAKAANLTQTAQLLLKLVAITSSGGSLTQVVVVPSIGVNSKGEIVETTKLVGIFQPKVDKENLSISITEKNGRKMLGLIGIIELTKVKLHIIGSATQTSNLVISPTIDPKAVAAKAVAAKAVAAKAAAAKTAAAKAAAAKAAAAKTAAAKTAKIKKAKK